MLFESDVVDAVCIELQSRGYHIQQKLKTNQRGDDIVAVKRTPHARELHIEAKGETSSRKASKRYGKPFDSAQIRVHVAEAFYKVAEILSRKSSDVEIRAGIALPASRKHRALVENIESALNQLNIAVFWVEEDGNVQVNSTWEV